MILSEMIKKYEKMQIEIIAEYGSRPTGELAWINAVLEDLRSMTKSVSMAELKTKVLQKMGAELDYGHIDDVFKLSHVLEMLCSQV